MWEVLICVCSEKDYIVDQICKRFKTKLVADVTSVQKKPYQNKVKVFTLGLQRLCLRTNAPCLSPVLSHFFIPGLSVGNPFPCEGT